LKFADLLMTIENGDEIFYLSQKICFHIPQLSIDIDEQRKIILRQTICYSYNSSLYFIILQTIDRLLILGSLFYAMVIRNIYYARPTKEIEKFEVIAKYMKITVDDHIERINKYCPEISDFRNKCRDLMKIPNISQDD
jgi:hypothetical protein